MKLILFLFFSILIRLCLFSQGLNDTIITKNLDTINCKITLVNDDNIFYDYKKKKSIKSSFISRNEVLKFSGQNLESKTLKRRTFKSCNDCENWIVNFYNDTIFYDLEVNFSKIDSTLIESVSFKDSISSINFSPCHIKYASWNGLNYFLTKPNLFYETNNNYIYLCDSMYLGYYIIKNKVSLIKYGSYYNYTQITSSSFGGINNSPIQNMNNSTFGVNKGSFLSPEYCLEVNSKQYKIPNTPRRFRLTMMDLLQDDKKLIERIENKEFEYDDIEEIVKIYNSSK